MTPDDLAVGTPEDLPGALLGRYAAGRTARRDQRAEKDPTITRLGELYDLETEVLPQFLGRSLGPFLHFLSSAAGSSEPRESIGGFLPLDVSV